jgi:hypothetical protein
LGEIGMVWACISEAFIFIFFIGMRDWVAVESFLEIGIHDVMI